MPVAKLNEKEISTVLQELNGWEFNNNGLEKQFKFGSFSSAMTFINKLAEEAEEMHHHPDWSNSYTLLNVRLTTHSINGLSNLDIELAKRIDKITEHGI
jgi:4a-hydroxytetrahydrobiopterin dehydratase